MSTTTKPTPTQTIKVTQQSLNLIRQIVAAVGWAKTVEDIYVGGQLLDAVLPEPDPIDWVKSVQELAALSPAEQKAYQRKDKAWCDKVIEFTLTARQVDTFKKAFENLVTEGKLAPNKYLSEIIVTFGLAKDE